MSSDLTMIPTRVKEVFMSLRAKCLIGLVGLGILDAVIPLPILGVILIYVILQRPPGFLEMVRELYEG